MSANNSNRYNNNGRYTSRIPTLSPEVSGLGTQGVYRVLSEIKQQLKTQKGKSSQVVSKPNKGNMTKSNKANNKVASQGVAKAETKIDGFIHRSIKQFQITLSDPITMILVAIVFFAAYTHHYSADDSLVKKLTSQLKEHEAVKPLGEWIESNVPKFFGMMMAVAASVSLKETIRYSTMVISGVIIMLMPTTTVTFYAITVASSLLYLRLKFKSDRFIVAGFIFLVYAYYFLDGKKSEPAPASPKAAAASIK